MRAAVFRELISGSRAAGEDAARRLSWARPYTYSHLAAIHRFGQSVELTAGRHASRRSSKRLIAGHADFGIVPIENSTDGRVADTLDMFTPAAGTDLRRSAAADPS